MRICPGSVSSSIHHPMWSKSGEISDLSIRYDELATRRMEAIMQRRLLAIATGFSLILVTALVTVLGAGSPAYAVCAPAQLIANPDFEVGTSPWTATAGTIGSFPSQPPH